MNRTMYFTQLKKKKAKPANHYNIDASDMMKRYYFDKHGNLKFSHLQGTEEPSSKDLHQQKQHSSSIETG